MSFPLAPITTKRLAVKVKSKAEKMIRQGHPWVFESSITKLKPAEGKAGDLAIIYGQTKNKFLGLGLYDPDSPIRIKLLQTGTSATIDETWFENKLWEAFKIRRPLLESDTNSYRLIHGENDGLPDLIIDIYDTVAVFKLYSRIWFPYLNILVNLVSKVSKTESTVLRLARKVLKQKGALYGLKDGQILKGALSDGEEQVFKEHGLTFSANLIKGHKTGFFLDHRHNRKRIGKLAEGKSVLDLFSYAGGFSVHAMAGGAKEVISLDVSVQALEMAEKNVDLNVEDPGSHSTMDIDVFEGLETLLKKKRTFDIVIVDPPSFAKKESEIQTALHSYRRLTKAAVKLVKYGGILVLASCSSRVSESVFFETVEGSMKEARIYFQLIDKTLHDSDHPIGFLEGAYLKCGYYQIG